MDKEKLYQDTVKTRDQILQRIESGNVKAEFLAIELALLNLCDAVIGMADTIEGRSNGH